MKIPFWRKPGRSGPATRPADKVQVASVSAIQDSRSAERIAPNPEVSLAMRAPQAHDPNVGKGYLGRRLFRVAVLLGCYFVLEVVVKAATFTQFVFFAWRKRPHAGTQRLGTTIARYMCSLWLYCTFASDEAPWPFSPWPRVESDGENK
jgi:hypothetical protein